MRRFSREMGRDCRGGYWRQWIGLRSYAWPGNIRELTNVLVSRCLRMRGSLATGILPGSCTRPGGPGRTEGGRSPGRGPELEGFIKKETRGRKQHGLIEETHRWVERILLPMVLEHTQGNRTQAAQVGVSPGRDATGEACARGATIQSSVDAVKTKGVSAAGLEIPSVRTQFPPRLPSWGPSTGKFWTI